MRSLIRLALGVSALAGSVTFVASAQSVISAKSGLIHYVEGRVFLNDQLVETKYGEFPDIKENQVLRTEEGRVEVLLTPGVFLRLGENGAIRMVTNRLIDTRLELLSGEAVVEADELLKDNGVTIVYKDYAVQIQKQGVYRFDSEPARLRVYDGEALVDLNGKTQEVKEGHALAMEGGLQVASFDKKDVDDLYRWGAHRSEYISMANVSAAKMVADSGTYMGDCSWLFNRYYNMYTFVPGYGCGLGNGFASGGFLMNPFGYGFWSPFSVYSYLYTLPYYGGGYYAPYPVGGSGGSSGSKPGHVVQPPIRIPSGGISPAVAARRTMAAATHAHVTGAGGSGHGSGSGSAASFSNSSVSHASSMSTSGHSGGGGGGGGHK